MKKFLTVIIFFCTISAPFNVSAKTEDDALQTVDNSIVIDRIGNNDIGVTLPSVIFTFTETEIKLKFNNLNHTKLLLSNGKIDFIINGEDQVLTFVNGEASFKHKFDHSKSLSIYTEDFSYNTTVTAYPLWAFLIPLAFIILWIIVKMMKK